MNEHQAAEFFDTLNRYVLARIAMTSVLRSDRGNFASHETQLEEATADLKEALRDIAVETTE